MHQTKKTKTDFCCFSLSPVSNFTHVGKSPTELLWYLWRDPESYISMLPKEVLQIVLREVPPLNPVVIRVDETMTGLEPNTTSKFRLAALRVSVLVQVDSNRRLENLFFEFAGGKVVRRVSREKCEGPFDENELTQVLVAKFERYVNFVRPENWPANVQVCLEIFFFLIDFWLLETFILKFGSKLWEFWCCGMRDSLKEFYIFFFVLYQNYKLICLHRVTTFIHVFHTHSWSTCARCLEITSIWKSIVDCVKKMSLRLNKNTAETNWRIGFCGVYVDLAQDIIEFWQKLFGWYS